MSRAQRATRAVLDDDGARKRDLAAIHMGKAALGWDDAQYRDILWTVCTVKSSAQLDFAGRKRFLAHLRACGWAGSPVKARRSPFTGRQAKIWSLWQQLADAGRVRDRKAPALDAYVSHQLGVAKMVWLNAQQQELLIERLKKWLNRPEAGDGQAAPGGQAT